MLYLEVITLDKKGNVLLTLNFLFSAIGRENPRIEGVLSSYSIGDFLSATCISAPADPLPTLTWLINGKQVRDK